MLLSLCPPLGDDDEAEPAALELPARDWIEKFVGLAFKSEGGKLWLKQGMA